MSVYVDIDVHRKRSQMAVATPRRQRPERGRQAPAGASRDTPPNQRLEPSLLTGTHHAIHVQSSNQPTR